MYGARAWRDWLRPQVQPGPSNANVGHRARRGGQLYGDSARCSRTSAWTVGDLYSRTDLRHDPRKKALVATLVFVQ